MKGIRYYLQLMTLACCACFVGCDDDDKDTPAAVFPEAQTMECMVGEEKTLTFEASADWALSSSALWCSFVVNGEKVYACSGTAGKHSVTVSIGDEATELLKSYRAELTLMMNGEQKVIYTLTRSVTGYEVRVYSEDESVEYTEENPLVQDYDGKIKYVVMANFDWVAEYPEEMSATVMSGVAGEKVVMRPLLTEGFTKESWQATVNFKNKENKVVVGVPVKYEGIPADKIEFSNENPTGTTITFSAYGDTYSVGEEEITGAMPLQVTAKDNRYVPVYVGYKEERNDLTWEYEYEFSLMAEDNSWFWVEDDQAGNLQISAGYNNDNALTGYLMVFPAAVYEKIKDNFEAEVFSIGGIKEPYGDYIAARLAQAANPRFTTGFKLTDGEGNPLSDGEGGTIEAYAYSDMGGELSEEELQDTYGTSNVYILSLPLNVTYEMILAKPNGFSGMYLQPDDYMNGVSTLWDGVSVAMDYPDGMFIYGLEAGVNGMTQMTIKCLDGSNVYAVLLIDPRY